MSETLSNGTTVHNLADFGGGWQWDVQWTWADRLTSYRTNQRNQGLFTLVDGAWRQVEGTAQFAGGSDRDSMLLILEDRYSGLVPDQHVATMHINADRLDAVSEMVDQLRSTLTPTLEATPHEALALAADLEERTRVFVRDTMRRARDAGLTFTEIGGAMGTTRQAAQQRLSRPLAERD